MPDWTDTIANRRNGLVPGFVGKDTPLGAALPAAQQITAGGLGARPPANLYGPGWWMGEDGSIWHSDGANWSRVAGSASSVLDGLAGGTVELYDNFNRSDRWLAAGIAGAPQEFTASGHRVDWQGTVPPYLAGGMMKLWGDDGTPIIAVVLDSAANTIPWNGHGLANNRKVRFLSVPANSGLTVDQDVYIVNAATNTFQVALTSGGAPIDIGGAGGAATLTGAWGEQGMIQMTLAEPPNTITFTGRFAPSPFGDSGNQEVLAICSDGDVSLSSVQCRIRKGPSSGHKVTADGGLFVYDPNVGGRDYQIEARPLLVPIPDGIDFTGSVTIDPVASTVTVRWPDGTVSTTYDARYAAMWGRVVSLQIVKGVGSGAAYGRAIVTAGLSLADRDRVITKTADDNPGNNTLGYVADPTLKDHIEAGQTKSYQWELRVDGSDSGNATFRVRAPTGATGDVSTLRLATGAGSAATAPIQDDLVFAGGPPPTATFNHGLFGPGTVTRLTVRATVYNGANAGDVELLMAQNSGPDAANYNRILKGSKLRKTLVVTP